MPTAASASTFCIKRGDLLPALIIQLLDDGEAFDLAGYTATLKARDQSGATVIDAAMSIVAADEGKVSYTWQAGDTDTEGGLDLEVELEHTASGKIRTFPDDGFIPVVITEDIDDA